MKNRPPISSSFLCSNETNLSLSYIKKQDNAEVHFKVKMGTKFKKVRVWMFRLLFFERRRGEILSSNWIRDFYNRSSGTHDICSFSFSLVYSYLQTKQIFDAFLQRKSLQPGSVRFLFDGERVREDQTPQELDMEDGDSLDVMMEQVGGK